MTIRASFFSSHFPLSTIRNFHFAFSATYQYTPSCVRSASLCIRSNARDPGVPGWQRQSFRPAQHASKQAQREMALHHQQRTAQVRAEGRCPCATGENCSILNCRTVAAGCSIAALYFESAHPTLAGVICGEAGRQGSSSNKARADP
jgi:hypothetical protein